MTLPLLLLLLTFTSSMSAHAADNTLEAFVKTKQAYVWSEPGWTYQDCEIPSANDRRWKERERILRTIRREEAKDVCAKREPEHLLQGMMAVTVVTRKVRDSRNRIVTEPEYEDRTTLYNGIEEKSRFYKVSIKVRNEKGELVDHEGYMAADQLTPPEKKEYERPPIAKKCKDCAITGGADSTGLPDFSKETAVASNFLEIQRKVPEIEVKSVAELDRFFCLHREEKGKTSAEIAADAKHFFEKRLPELSKAAADAEATFGIPKELIQCTLLVESGLKPDKYNVGSQAKGYSQVIPDTMDFLLSIESNSKYQYHEMWTEYQKTNKKAILDNHHVRNSNNLQASVGATALYYRFMFDNHIANNNGCKDCSKDLQALKRKDIYLLAAGYNGGHAYIEGGKIRGQYVIGMNTKSPSEIRASFPPPPESRRYVEKIEKCMGKGWETSFVESSTDLQKINQKRKKTIAALEKKIAYNKKVYDSRVRAYEKNVDAQQVREAALAEIQSGERKGKAPPPVKALPMPKSLNISEDEKQIDHLNAMMKIDANHSYSDRFDECNKRFATPVAESTE